MATTKHGQCVRVVTNLVLIGWGGPARSAREGPPRQKSVAPVSPHSTRLDSGFLSTLRSLSTATPTIPGADEHEAARGLASYSDIAPDFRGISGD